MIQVLRMKRNEIGFMHKAEVVRSVKKIKRRPTTRPPKMEILLSLITLSPVPSSPVLSSHIPPFHVSRVVLVLVVAVMAVMVVVVVCLKRCVYYCYLLLSTSTLTYIYLLVPWCLVMVRRFACCEMVVQVITKLVTERLMTKWLVTTTYSFWEVLRWAFFYYLFYLLDFLQIHSQIYLIQGRRRFTKVNIVKHSCLVTTLITYLIYFDYLNCLNYLNYLLTYNIFVASDISRCYVPHFGMYSCGRGPNLPLLIN